MIVLSVQRNDFFFHRTELFTCYPSLSREMWPYFIQLDRRPPGLSTKQSLATTVEERGKGGGISRRRQSLKGGTVETDCQF